MSITCMLITDDSTIGTFSTDTHPIFLDDGDIGDGFQATVDPYENPAMEFCEVCARTHAVDPEESCQVGEATRRGPGTLTRDEARAEAYELHAVAVLPTGSHVPSFTDRCNVVRSESYAAQRARNARFEHLRRLLCKPTEEPKGPGFQESMRTSHTVLPHQTGPVWINGYEFTAKSGEHVVVEGDRPDAFSVRERARTEERTEVVGFDDEHYLMAYDFDPEDTMILHDREEWPLSHAGYVTAEMVDAEEADEDRFVNVRLRDLAAGFPIQVREKGQITASLTSGWITWTESQAKLRVQANLTTLYVTMRLGKLELHKVKARSVQDAIAKRDAWIKRAGEQVKARRIEPMAMAKASTQYSNDVISDTRRLRDTLSRNGYHTNVRFIR